MTHDVILSFKKKIPKMGWEQIQVARKDKFGNLNWTLWTLVTLDEQQSTFWNDLSWMTAAWL